MISTQKLTSLGGKSAGFLSLICIFTALLLFSTVSSAGVADIVALYDFTPSFVVDGGTTMDEDSSAQTNWSASILLDNATGTGALGEGNRSSVNRDIVLGSYGNYLAFAAERESDPGLPTGVIGESTWLTFSVSPAAAYQFDFTGELAKIDTYASTSISGTSSADWTLYYSRDGGANWNSLGTKAGASFTGASGTSGPTTLSWDLSPIGTQSSTVSFLIDPVTTGDTGDADAQISIGLDAVLINAVVDLTSADFTWDGSNSATAWNSVEGISFDTNWTPNSLIFPGVSDTVMFSDTATDFVVKLNGDRSVKSATFAGVSDYQIVRSVNGDSLTLATGDITAVGTATHSLSADIILGGNGNWLIDNPLVQIVGDISGAFGLDKTGSGTLELIGYDQWNATSSSYTGSTKIVEGTLIAKGFGGRIPAASLVKIKAGAALRIDGITETIDALVNSSGSLFLDTGATLQLTPTAPQVFLGMITGASGTTFEITGGTTQTLDAASPGFFGTTLITGGTIKLGSADALQSSTVDIQVVDGLDINGFDANLGGLSGTGTGNLDIGSQKLTVGGNNDTTTYSGILSGVGGSLTKQGDGALTLRGINTYDGATVINKGMIKLGHATALQNSSVQINADDGLDINTNNASIGALAGTGNLDIGSQILTAGGNSASTLYTGVLSGAGGRLIKTGNGKLSLSGSNTYSGGTTINGGTLALGTGSSAGPEAITMLGSTLDYIFTSDLQPVELSNTIDLQSNATLNVSAGIPIQSGVIGETSGPWGISKTGDGTLMLSAVNTYSGATQINSGAIILGNANALQNSTVDIQFDNGLNINSLDAILGGLAGIGKLNIGSQTLTVGGNSNVTDYSGVLSGTGNLIKQGNDALTLSGINTYGGATTINAGSIVLGNANALQSSTVDIQTPDGLNINSLDAILGGLAGIGNLDIGSQTLIVGGNGDGTAYSGVISGTGNLMKQGIGVLTLSAVNTYGGTTTVNGGTLSVVTGGKINNADGLIGLGSDSTATVTVTGNGSQWNNSDKLGVGTDGSGTLNVSAGGLVSNTVGLLGTNAGSVGIATVTGSDSQWNSSSNLDVGKHGNGTLNVEAGGVVSNTIGYIGRWGESISTATVTGSGSHWNGSGYLSIGNVGDGTLNIEAGGVVSNTIGYIGRLSGSTGAATVTGSGSQWNNTGDLNIGGTESDAGTTATLTIADNGQVSVGGTTRIWSAGTINLTSGAMTANTINATTGMFTFTGGTLAVDLFEGDLTQQGGTLAAGASPGTTDIDGNYDLQAGSLEVEIAGVTGGSLYDVYDVSGNVNVGGTLDVLLLAPFSPTLGDSFAILRAVNITGDFDLLNLPALGTDLKWDVSYLKDFFDITDIMRLTVVSTADTPELTLTIVAASVSENDGAAATTATVSRNTDTTNELVVNLSSNDPSEATVPVSVTIAAGQSTSPSFDINAVADAIVDGTQKVTITATAAAHADGTDTLDVTDAVPDEIFSDGFEGP